MSPTSSLHSSSFLSLVLGNCEQFVYLTQLLFDGLPEPHFPFPVSCFPWNAIIFAAFGQWNGAGEWSQRQRMNHWRHKHERKIYSLKRGLGTASRSTQKIGFKTHRTKEGIRYESSAFFFEIATLFHSSLREKIIITVTATKYIIKLYIRYVWYEIK